MLKIKLMLKKAAIDNFENEMEIDFLPCGTCSNIFAFHKEVRENMGDECLIFIAQREQIDLRNKYQCTVCKEVFQTKTLFRLHTQCIFETDSLDLVYICESCNQVWIDEETFEQHMKLKHVIHICVRCNARREGKNSLDDHFRAKHRAF